MGKKMGKKKTPKKNEQPIPAKAEVFMWEELLLAKTEAGDSIINQQHLIVGLIELYEKVIENDIELFNTIKGLLKTLEDLAKDINTISLEHATVTTKLGEFTIGSEFKKGVVAIGVDQMSYIEIAAKYLSIIDKVAHLAGTAYLDVFTRLKTDTSELAKAINDGIAAVEKIRGNKNGK
jgi:hypothetical protein